MESGLGRKMIFHFVRERFVEIANESFTNKHDWKKLPTE